MTTHIVEIRPRNRVGRFDAPWQPLTRSPIAKAEAERLVRAVGELWEERVVAVASPAGREFAELELQLAHTAAERGNSAPVVQRWEPISINHHPSCRVKDDRRPLSVAATFVGNNSWATRLFGESPKDAMTAEEWIALGDVKMTLARFTRPILDSLGVRSITLDDNVYVHAGECTGTCGATARALSVKITIRKPTECGRDVIPTMREYSLTPRTPQ